MELVPIDENGFWAFVSSDESSPGLSTGGYVTMLRVGPFDFMRLDYTLAGVREGPSRPFMGKPDAVYSEVRTILFPIHALPVIQLSTKEEVYGEGSPI